MDVDLTLDGGGGVYERSGCARVALTVVCGVDAAGFFERTMIPNNKLGRECLLSRPEK